jgi:competence ComEA-like helix-hairpin-helix protein
VPAFPEGGRYIEQSRIAGLFSSPGEATMPMRDLLGKGLLAGLALILLCTVVLSQKKPPAKPVDLNAATIKELEELPGVGPVTAQRILDARQKSGRFRRIEDLLAIRGISTKRLEALRPYITVSAPPPSPAKKQ